MMQVYFKNNELNRTKKRVQSYYTYKHAHLKRGTVLLEGFFYILKQKQFKLFYGVLISLITTYSKSYKNFKQNVQNISF